MLAVPVNIFRGGVMLQSQDPLDRVLQEKDTTGFCVAPSMY